MKSLVHRSLTGSRIAIDIPDEIAPRHVGTTVTVFSIGGVDFEFTAGTRVLGAAVAADFGSSLTEKLRMQQGTLRLGSTMESWAAPEGHRFTKEHSVAVWEGPRGPCTPTSTTRAPPTSSVS